MNTYLHGAIRVREITGYLYWDTESSQGKSIQFVYQNLMLYLKEEENQIYKHWKLKLQFLEQGFRSVISYKWKQLHSFLSNNHGLGIGSEGHTRNLENWAYHGRGVAILIVLKEFWEGGDWETLKQTYDSIEKYAKSKRTACTSTKKLKSGSEKSRKKKIRISQ